MILEVVEFHQEYTVNRWYGTILRDVLDWDGGRFDTLDQWYLDTQLIQIKLPEIVIDWIGWIIQLFQYIYIYMYFEVVEGKR